MHNVTSSSYNTPVGKYPACDTGSDLYWGWFGSGAETIHIVEFLDQVGLRL